MFCSGSVVILADAVCAALAGGAVFAAAVAAAGGAALLSNDPGGPLFLPMAALGALLAAGLAAGTLFALALVVEGLRRLARARWWVTSLVAVPAVSAAAAGIALAAGATPVWTLATAAIALFAFGVYWHAYLAAEIVLTHLADRLFPSRACAPRP